MLVSIQFSSLYCVAHQK